MSTVAGSFSATPSRNAALLVVSAAVLLFALSLGPQVAQRLSAADYVVTSGGMAVSTGAPAAEAAAVAVSAGAALGALPRVLELWPVGGNNSRPGVRRPRLLPAHARRWPRAAAFRG